MIALVSFVSSNPHTYSSDIHSHDDVNHTFLLLIYFDIVSFLGDPGNYGFGFKRPGQVLFHILFNTLLEPRKKDSLPPAEAEKKLKNHI